MSFEELVHEVAETLRAVPDLAGVPVIEDEVGDPATELEKAVAKTRVAALVGWTSFEPVKQGNAGGFVIGDVTVTVSLFEKPAVNRATGIRAAALAVAKALTYGKTDAMICPLFLKQIRPPAILEDKSKTVGMDIEFSTKVEL